MRRTLIVGGLLGAIVVAVGVIYSSSPSHARRHELVRHVDAAKLLAAAKTCADGLRAQNAPVPASVSLRELIARNLVTEADVSGLADTEVTVSLTADESRPQEVLIRARMADGHEVVALADGSVHTR
ncbi:MAG TPA: hypothetical protein PK640_09215 [Verrucomicrobiota bacterium]|nr:hypothetical protein [Verrucomicrobiota bacterium]